MELCCWDGKIGIWSLLLPGIDIGGDEGWMYYIVVLHVLFIGGNGACPFLGECLNCKVISRKVFVIFVCHSQCNSIAYLNLITFSFYIELTLYPMFLLRMQPVSLFLLTTVIHASFCNSSGYRGWNLCPTPFSLDAEWIFHIAFHFLTISILVLSVSGNTSQIWGEMDINLVILFVYRLVNLSFISGNLLSLYLHDAKTTKKKYISWSQGIGLSASNLLLSILGD